MHFNFAFNAAQIIWTLTFAAQLVLLVVLLGRDRAKLFPIFTLGTVLAAFRWLANRMLFQRIAPIPGQVIFLVIATVVTLVNLALLAELAVQAFRDARQQVKLVGGGAVLAIALAFVIWWGPWPAWRTFAGGGLIIALRTMQLVAQRGDMLCSALSLQLALLVAIYGRRLGAGWRSHRQLLLVGLGALGACQLTMIITWRIIATHAVIHTQEEYVRLLGLGDKLNNTNSALYILVLIWWIGSLWIEEPGTAAAPPTPATEDVPATPEN